MIHGKTFFGIIPARGGSKGVPGKNIREVGGKPLIAWTIQEAKKSRHLDRLILSSEDQEIVETARAWDCEVPFLRPSELARDDTPGVDPVLHAIETLSTKYDYVVLLQPTSPLRKADDIDGCIEHCLRKNAPACISVTRQNKGPYWMFTINTNGRMVNIFDSASSAKRRQDLPEVYALNGAVYVAETDWIAQKRAFISDHTVAYIMPRERSIDIDDQFDMDLFAFLVSSTNRKTGSPS
jgi:CMP-N,N'-diacetyllegionaminic acid synthase